MTTPVAFTSKSARFGLPFLFTGQAQKEFYINEASALVDALLHPVVEGQADTPPAQPADGDCWLVDANPTAEWLGHPQEIACFQSGSWLFAKPQDGMRVFVRSLGADMRYLGGWRSPASVAPISGGATIDAEARAAIADLVQALTAYGIVR